MFPQITTLSADLFPALKQVPYINQYRIHHRDAPFPWVNYGSRLKISKIDSFYGIHLWHQCEGGLELQIDLLKTFLAIIATGGFSNASAVVPRSQSAISLQIKRLEKTIGQSLFKRAGRSFRLAAAGETLVPYARRMMKLHEEMVAVIRKPEVVGLVRLGIIDDYASRFLREILSPFAHTFPKVQVTVRCKPSLPLLPLRMRGELDLALVTGSPNEKDEIIRNDPAVWVTSPNCRSQKLCSSDPLRRHLRLLNAWPSTIDEMR